MTRQFPAEIFIGQRVFLRFDPTSSPIISEVTWLDFDNGLVHVQPVGYTRQLAARPRALTDLRGLYLHFENAQFFFSETPAWH
ncbi:MAG: hypothetical protein MUE40_04765 [Anaerolineae bacterium]|jgi:hypothetical protein|nr:hypothetical protein [Anaerolineae bacterium]